MGVLVVVGVGVAVGSGVYVGKNVIVGITGAGSLARGAVDSWIIMLAGVPPG
jgi:hypothetical protein